MAMGVVQEKYLLSRISRTKAVSIDENVQVPGIVDLWMGRRR